MKQDISYQKYREEIEKLNFQKAAILQAIKQKKQAHIKYREYLKEYNEHDRNQEQLTKELLDMV